MQNMIVSSNELMHVGASGLQGGFCEILRPTVLGRTILIFPFPTISPPGTPFLILLGIALDLVLFFPSSCLFSFTYYHSYLLCGFLSSGKVWFLRASTWSFRFLHIFQYLLNCPLTSVSINLVHTTVSTWPHMDLWSLCIHPHPHPTPTHLTKSNRVARLIQGYINLILSFLSLTWFLPSLQTPPCRQKGSACLVLVLPYQPLLDFCLSSKLHLLDSWSMLLSSRPQGLCTCCFCLPGHSHQSFRLPPQHRFLRPALQVIPA